MNTQFDPNADLSYLAEISRMYSRLGQDESGGIFLEELKGLGTDRLIEYRDWAEKHLIRRKAGVARIRPVVFLRRVIVDRVLNGEAVTAQDLEELQRRIEQQDTDYFKDYPAYLDALVNREVKKRGPFVNWNAFRILFYIDYYHRAQAVKEALNRLADRAEALLDMPGLDRHLAGFDFNQNFGTDSCWLALFPNERGGHQEAVQLFIRVNATDIACGLAAGARIEFEQPRLFSQSHDAIDFDVLVTHLAEQRAAFVAANRVLVGPEPTPDPHPSRNRVNRPHPLNVILYGPPGTGKTHALRERAVRIADGSTADLSDEQINARFRELLEEGQVEFITFHPSYSYEEFVEGLRYDRDEKIPLLHDGILKRLAKKAINPFQRAHAQEGARIWKVSLGDASEGHIFERCMAENHIAVGWLASNDLSGWEREEISEAFQAQGASEIAGRIQSMDRLVNEIKDGDFVAILGSQTTIRAIGVVEGSYHYLGPDIEYPHTRPVRWLDKGVHDIYEMNGQTRLTLSTIYPLDRVQLGEFLGLMAGGDGKTKPHVLIIDEINRGDPARIFGELITLLEADKRRGAENELTVRLPYSQELFALPGNLFVLGTMNSTDRSIALMDSALRRRFEFEELNPDVNVIRDSLEVFLDDDDGLDFEITPDQVDLICVVFEVLNARISILLDADHRIGHSYFMGLRTMRDLHRVLYRQVLPLLQEYFHGDRDRMVRLLGAYNAKTGSGFISSPLTAAHAGLDGDGLSDVDLPWGFHTYSFSELEGALEGTFLPGATS